MDEETQQNLFNHLAEQHDLILLESELQEIYHLCGGYDKDDRIKELKEQVRGSRRALELANDPTQN